VKYLALKTTTINLILGNKHVPTKAKNGETDGINEDKLETMWKQV
jgi:ribosome biogenesis GTPase A